MSGGIFELPQRDLIEATKIHEAIQKIRKKRTQNVELLFSLKKGHIEVVEKKSLRGAYLLRTSEKSLKLGEQRIKQLANRIQNLRLSEEERKEKKVDIIMSTLQSVDKYPPESTDLRERNVTIQSSSADTKSTVVAEKAVIEEASRNAAHLKKAVVDAFPSCDISPVMAHLLNYPDLNQLLSALDAATENIEGAMSALEHALSRALITASDDEVEAFEKIFLQLDHARPERPVENELTNSVTLNNLALVFGDAFIKDSSIDGGDVTRPYAELAARALDALDLPSEKAKALREVLANGIDLKGAKTKKDTEEGKKTGETKAEALRNEIRNKLQALPKGEQRCLLFGGWAEHAIVYEIEKQANGKYAFRVYNEGEGVSFHHTIQDKYKTKHAGCIAIQDIPEKLLFRRSFLASLQELCKIKQDAPEILVGNILPLLDGKEEKMDPRIQHFVSPQRSGTCTYRSLQAFFAHTMAADEYKVFKFEYKLFLLKRYLPALQDTLKQKINDEKAYYDLVQEYGIIKRSLEKFSGGIHNLSGSLYPHQLERATTLIDRYDAALKRLDTKIIGYEKAFFSLSLSQLKGDVASDIKSDQFKMAEAVVKMKNPKPTKYQFPTTMTTALGLIDNMAPLTCGHAIQELLDLLSDASLAPYRVYLADLLLKKVGSLDAWKNIVKRHAKVTPWRH